MISGDAVVACSDRVWFLNIAKLKLSAEIPSQTSEQKAQTVYDHLLLKGATVQDVCT